MAESFNENSQGSIRALDQTSVHRLHSGQVVLSLESCLKELVENAMDAGATVIEVKLRENGLESVEVVDNGCGIKEEDWSSIGLKHHTSKLPLAPSISSLSSLTTFGFRGEAISALCALSESVVVTTATKEMAPLGRVLKFDKGGNLVDREGKVARQRGTTILVTSLFNPLPVRRKELERNIKKEFPKALNLLTAYALVPASGSKVGAAVVTCPEVGSGVGGASGVSVEGDDGAKRAGIRLTVDSIGKNGKRTNHLKTDGKASLRSSVALIWGNKALEHILDLDVEVEVEMDKAMARREGLEVSSTTVRLKGLVSDAAFGCGRSTADRQFFYVNGRPFAAQAIARTINEAYKSFNTHQNPFIVLDIQLPGDAVDVNVSPDKRLVFMHNEANLLEAVRSALDEFWQPSRSTFVLDGASGNKNALPQSKRLGISRPATLIGIQVDELESEDQPQPTQEISLEDRRARVRSPSPLIDAPASARSARLAPRSHSSVERPRTQRMVATGTPTTPGKTHMEYEEEESTDEEDDDATVPESQSLPPPSLQGRPFKINGVTVSPSAKLVQTKLDTSTAAWGTTRTSGQRAPPVKAPANPTSGRASKLSLRDKLAGFASQRPIHQSDESAGDETLSSLDGHVSSDEAEPRQSAGEHLSDRQEDLSDDEQSGSGQQGLSGRNDSPSDVDRTAHTGDSDLFAALTPNHASGPSDTPQSQGAGCVDGSSVAPSGPNSYRDEIATQGGTRQIVIRCDMERIRQRCSAAKGKQVPASTAISTSAADILHGAGLEATADEADNALSRVIHKEDFAAMEVLGQFNLALIIARRRTGMGKQAADDLFIIDQHASDEKYNFETLQLTTRIRGQALIKPRELQLTSADEITASENVDILEQNGFGVSIDEDAPYGRGLRVKLTAMPISKDTKFDAKDLEELIYLLQDNHARNTIRCKKARAMFAMRACRKSVMFGKALNKSQMTEIVRHMGVLDQPWNCPHGRPTMRHLAGLAKLGKENKEARSRNEIAWSSIELD